MPLLVRFAAILSLALLACAAALTPALADDATLDAPPPDLVKSTATLSDILAAHDKAVGKLPAGMADTAVERWYFVDTGLRGTLDLERSGTNYHSRIVAGSLVEEFGQNADGRWHKDRNGITSSTTAIDDKTFYASRVLEDAADPKNDVTILGETTGTTPAYVVSVKRPGRKHPEFVFYDKTSGQVVRVERVAGGHRWIETYDNFKTTDGVTTAWHFHDTDGHVEFDDDWTLLSISHGTAIADSTFAKPPSQPTVDRVATATQIATHEFAFGDVVRVNVQGRGLDFLLDSASPESAIDRDVAIQLHLPTFGQYTQRQNGKPLAFDTIIPDGDVDSKIQFHNFALRAEDIAFQPETRTRIVGVLGYDFFAANVIHYDLIDNTLEALPGSTFTGVADGTEIPLTIDDGYPLVTVGVGSDDSASALVSTADPYTLVTGTFVANHPTELKDAPDSNHHSGAIVPFADEQSYGIEIEVWMAIAPTLHFGIATLKNAYVPATNYPMVVNDHNVDVVLGLNGLQFYDLYFDYPHSRFIVKPNKGFFKVFHTQ